MIIDAVIENLYFHNFQHYYPSRNVCELLRTEVEGTISIDFIYGVVNGDNQLVAASDPDSLKSSDGLRIQLPRLRVNRLTEDELKRITNKFSSKAAPKVYGAEDQIMETITKDHGAFLSALPAILVCIRDEQSPGSLEKGFNYVEKGYENLHMPCCDGDTTAPRPCNILAHELRDAQGRVRYRRYRTDDGEGGEKWLLCDAASGWTGEEKGWQNGYEIDDQVARRRQSRELQEWSRIHPGQLLDGDCVNPEVLEKLPKRLHGQAKREGWPFREP